MKIDIRTVGVPVSEALRQHWHTRLASAVRVLGRRATRVSLYVCDVNGSKGGVDKQCRAVVQVRRQSPLVLTDRGTSVGAMVEQVADRVEHAAARLVERLGSRSGQISMSGE